uniref:Reverse transcriptase zinc-binding domain-containing protein n=1 Tax=Cannabis sativa TaxID=3483 RepID=A0A803QJG1_CANSA
MCVGSKIGESLANSLATSMGVSLVTNHTKYLGMPTFIGKNKKQIFGKVREKVEAKLQGWKRGLFSQAGKEILIKAVIQALPCYVMSCFRITKGILHDIESLIARFWWGSTSNNHKIHWGKWSKLCKLKENGGMGFRDLEDFNQALLAKQGWKILQQPDCLPARVLKALYFPNENFFEAKLGHFGSSVWRGILWGRDLIVKVHKSDWITWSLTNNGQYSVASGYKLRFQDPELAACSNNDTTKAWWKFVWGSKLTPKMKNFIWKVFNNWIPAKTVLKKRGIELNTICDWCKSQHEDIYHALWGCPSVQGLWEQLGFSQLMPTTVLAADDFLWWLWKHMEKEELLRFIGFSWLIWQRRNNFVFQQKHPADHLWLSWAVDFIAYQLGQQQQLPLLVHNKPTVSWQPPPSDFHLINTDASLKLGHLGCGLSAIIRNSAGDLVVVG